MGPFLEENASEVVNMLMTEWNTEEYGRVQRAEGREEGRQEGRQEGREEGRIEGLIESLKRLMTNPQVSFQQAATLLKLTPEEVEACSNALTSKDTSA